MNQDNEIQNRLTNLSNHEFLELVAQECDRRINSEETCTDITTNLSSREEREVFFMLAIVSFLHPSYG